MTRQSLRGTPMENLDSSVTVQVLREVADLLESGAAMYESGGLVIHHDCEANEITIDSNLVVKRKV